MNEKAKTPPGRRIIRIAGCVFAGLIGLIAVALVGAKIYFDDERLARVVSTLASGNLAGTFHFASIHWRLPAAVSVADLEISAPDGEEVIHADRLEASLNPLALLRKKLSITRVGGDGVRVRLVPPRPGSTSTSAFSLIDAFGPRRPSPEPEPNADGGLPISIEAGDVDIARLDVEVDTKDLHALVRGARVADGGFGLSNETIEGRGSVAIEELRLQRKPEHERIELGPIHVELDRAAFEEDRRSAASTVEVERALVRVNGSSIEVKGKVAGIGGPESPRGDATAELVLALDDAGLRSLAPEGLLAELAPRGSAHLSLEARGSLDRAKAKLALDGDGLTVRGLPLERLAVEGSIDRRVVAIDSLSLHWADSHVSASGSADLSGKRVSHRGRVVATRVPVRAIAAGFVDPDLLPETVSATIAFSGDSISPPSTDLRARIEVDGIPRALTRGALPSAGIELDGAIRRDHASIERLAIARGPIQLTAHGRAPFDDRGPVDLSIELVDRAAAGTLARMDLPLRADRIAVALRATGTIRTPVAVGSIAAAGIRGPNIASTDIALPVRLTGGTLSVEDGRIILPSGSIRLDGQAHVLDVRGKPIANPEVKGRIAASRIALGDLSGGAVDGIATATIALEGTPARYRARALAEVPNLVVNGSTLAFARVDVEGDHHRLQIRDLLVRPTKGGLLRGSGTIDVDRKVFTGRIAGQKLPAAMISDATDLPGRLAGTIDLDLEGAGSLDKPHMKASIRTSRITLDDQALGSARAAATGGLDRIDAWARIDDDQGVVAANVRYFAEKKTVEGRIAGRKIKIRKLLLLTDQSISIDGDVGADFRFAGEVPYPQLDGAIAITGLELAGDPVPKGGSEIRLSTRDNDGVRHYRVDADVVHAMKIAADIRPKGATSSARADPVARAAAATPISGEVEATIEDLQLEKLIPSIKERGITSHLRGRAKLALGKRIDGRLVLDTLSAEFGDKKIQAAEPIRLDLAGSRVIVRSFRLEGTEGTFELRGHVGSDLALDARGALELGFIEPLVPQLAQAAGAIRLAVAVAGSPSKPIANGTLAIATPIDVRPRGSTRMIHLEKADISIAPGKVTIRNLAGGMGSGTFGGHGTIALIGVKPSGWDVDIEGQNLSFSTKDVVIDADAKIHAYGTAVVPSLSGEIRIVRGRYTKQLELDRFNFIARKEDEDEGGPSEQPAWMSEMELDLHALSTGTINLKVDAEAFSMKIDLTNDLRIKGTAAEPRIDGRITAESGEIKFPSAKLPLTGAVDFVPTIEEPIHPIIDITAEGDVRGTGGDGRQRDYHVTVGLKGSAEQMTLELSSPELADRTDVLALLITGNADVTSIAQGTKSDEPQPLAPGLAFAGSQLAAPATRFLEQQLEKELNLQLELRTEVTSEGFRVVAGKELTRRIHLEGGYGRSFVENAAVASTSATLQMTDRFFLEGSAQTINAFGNSVAALQEGAAGRLELKLRVLGAD
jgi:autotransporter translocation and assembly factor TamB